MFEFQQYLGFLLFLTILTIGFWLMFFLVGFVPYWIGGSLKELYKEKTFDQSVAIGPLVMMKYTALLNKEYKIPTDVSLNPIMIDGTGMCGNCRVTINEKTFFACIDGPDFPGEGVDFDELIARQEYYKEEEHICRLRQVK